MILKLPRKENESSSSLPQSNSNAVTEPPTNAKGNSKNSSKQTASHGSFTENSVFSYMKFNHQNYDTKTSLRGKIPTFGEKSEVEMEQQNKV